MFSQWKMTKYPHYPVLSLCIMPRPLREAPSRLMTTFSPHSLMPDPPWCFPVSTLTPWGAMLLLLGVCECNKPSCNGGCLLICQPCRVWRVRKPILSSFSFFQCWRSNPGLCSCLPSAPLLSYVPKPQTYPTLEAGGVAKW